MALGGLRQQVCADGIVLHGRNRIAFEERHLFVGGGVNYDFGLALFKEFVEQSAIAEISQNRRADMAAWKGIEIEVNLVKVAFGVFEKDEGSRAEAEERFGQRGTDGAAGSGKQHTTIGEGIVHKKVIVTASGRGTGSSLPRR